MRAHNRKSSARSVRDDGVTATRNARADSLARAMAGTIEQRAVKVNHPSLQWLHRETSGLGAQSPLQEHIFHRRLRRLRPAIATPAMPAFGLLEEQCPCMTGLL